MTTTDDDSWFRSEGEMAELIRAHDWAATPLGPLAQWPDALRFGLNMLLPSQAQMVLFWGPDLLAFYNDAYRPTIGHKHPHILGRPAREGWAELWDDLGPLLAAVIERGETVAASDRPFRIDRAGYLEEVFFDISYSPVRGPQGEIQGALCIVAETTGRVMASRRLAESEARLRESSERIELALNAGAVAGTWVWNVAADQFIADERFSRTFALPAARLAEGMPLAEVKQSIHPEDLPRVNDLISDAIAHGGAYRAEYRVLGAQGQWHWIEANGRVELDAQGRAARFPGVLIDIERRRAAEAALRASEERYRRLSQDLEARVQERTRALSDAQATLRQAQKMEAVGQLTGGLAHDFNNLLGTISNSLQILRLRLEQGKPEGLGRYLAMADDSIRRAAALTHRLLAFSRKQTLDPKPMDVTVLVQGMEELVRRTMGPSIETRIDCQAGLWVTRLDGSQLENSLLNLCINARDAMPQGGELVIRTRNEALAAERAASLGLGEGDYVMLCVQDTGSGIAPDVLDRIFDPFFTTKPIGVGTGLGLSMVYGFVRQSGGQVHVQSSLGEGTTMCLYLPRFRGQALQEAPAPAPSLVSGAGETVVVIEDEYGIRATIEEVLADAGYRVLGASTGSAGLRMLEAEPEVALLITDVGLPGGMNGRQIAEAARERRPGLKVLFITGYDNAVVSDGNLGARSAVLTKPFELPTLSQRVRAMIDPAG